MALRKAKQLLSFTSSEEETEDNDRRIKAQFLTR
jgi:hypothetical protein